MPALSPTMTQGNIGTWKKKIGDAVVPGDVLVEIETDKATMDFECQDEGYLASILAPEGTKDFLVGKPLAVFVEEKGDVPAFKGFKVETESKVILTTPDQKAPKETKQNITENPASSNKPKAEVVPRSVKNERIIASPVAKFLAQSHHVDLSNLAGSGPNQRILKHDVLNAIEETKATPIMRSASVPFIDIELSNVRKIIAQRLTESKQSIPHYYLTSEIDMTNLLRARENLNATGKGEYKISVNDFIIKACALAMKHVPEVNSSWQETFIRQYNKVDISVAVATDSGLITPIVTDADLKGLKEISNEVKSLANLAKRNKLKPEQFQGGTFTISNLGMYEAIASFTAIINPPQSCILAVGTVQKRLHLAEDDSMNQREIMQVTLSCDHRVVDGATGAKWLGWLKKYLEEPAHMLL